MKTTSYKDLIVWQKSMYVVERVYLLTEKLPKIEKFGLSSQLQRSAVGVPSNIAEGYKRNNIREYIQFCGIAAGSLAELETQLLIARNVYKIDTQEILELADEVSKMLYTMIKQLKAKL